MKPRAELVDPRAMSTEDRDQLWQFFSSIVRRSREQFELGLAAYPELRLWRHPQTGAIVGFSAGRWLEVEVGGRTVDVLYGGWMAVAPELRNRGLTWRDCFARFWKKALFRRGRPGYVVFASSTYKSYRSLVRYAPACWPQRERAMPTEVAAIVEATMRHLGETNYDAAQGVLRRFGKQRYREGVYADSLEVLADPVVAYYAERNPRQHEGDSLLIAYELTWRNLLQSGLRCLRRPPVRGGRTIPSIETEDAGVKTAEP